MPAKTEKKPPVFTTLTFKSDNDIDLVALLRELNLPKGATLTGIQTSRDDYGYGY